MIRRPTMPSTTSSAHASNPPSSSLSLASSTSTSSSSSSTTLASHSHLATFPSTLNASASASASAHYSHPYSAYSASMNSHNASSSSSSLSSSSSTTSKFTTFLRTLCWPTAACLPEYIRRSIDYRQLDMEHAMAQLMLLCKAPNEVYKSTQYRKEIKNQWARDDPALVILITLAITIMTCITWMAYGHSVMQLCTLLCHTVIFDFIILGMVMATLTRWLSNKYLKVQRSFTVEQDTEWLFAFDIHCNGFFPLFLILHVLQFVLSPYLLSSAFSATLLANSLYAISFSIYFYHMFLGYSALPFMRNTQVFLFPIGLIAVAFILSLLVGFNASKFVYSIYF